MWPPTDEPRSNWSWGDADEASRGGLCSWHDKGVVQTCNVAGVTSWVIVADPPVLRQAIKHQFWETINALMAAECGEQWRYVTLRCLHLHTHIYMIFEATQWTCDVTAATILVSSSPAKYDSSPHARSWSPSFHHASPASPSSTTNRLPSHRFVPQEW